MEIKVIGAGIIGLTTAVHLAEKGYEVKLVAEKFSPNTTSDKAGAIWFPYKALPKYKVTAWSRSTLTTLKQQARNQPHSGVSLVDLVIFTDKTSYEKEWWEDALPPQYPMSFTICDHYANRQSFYTLMNIPFLEPAIYLKYLFTRFINITRSSYEQRKVVDLAAETSDCDVVINCTGYGAKALLKDNQLIPVRGQILVVENTGLKQFYIDDVDQGAMAYIFTRKNEIILGGTAEENIEEAGTVPSILEDILKRCKVLSPDIKDQKILGQYGTIRPMRKTIRLEKEKKLPIIHNYGHGGAGFTMAWGCAEAVEKLLLSMQLT